MVKPRGYFVLELPAAPLEPVLEPLPMPLPMPVLPAPVVPLAPLLALRRSSRRHFSFSSPVIESHLVLVLLEALPPMVLPVPTLAPDGEAELLELEGVLALPAPEALDGELALPLLPDMVDPAVPEAPLLVLDCSFRHVSLCAPVRPSQRALEVPVAPVPEPVLMAGGTPVAPEVPGVALELPELPEVCANAALARSAAAVAVPSNFNIVNSFQKVVDRDCDLDTQRSCRRGGHALRDL